MHITFLHDLYTITSFVIRCVFFSLQNKVAAWFPYVILSLIGAMGMVAASFLPETLSEELPQTVPEAEEFLPNESFFSYKGKIVGPGCRWTKSDYYARRRESRASTRVAYDGHGRERSGVVEKY